MNNSQDISILFDDSSEELLKTGISQTLEQYESLLLDLFQELREAGMALTLEQYDLLQKAVEKGYGLRKWSDLKRLCRLLWVKPCPNYDLNVFEQAFDDYHKRRVEILVEPEPEQPKDPPIGDDYEEPPSNLQIPPRTGNSPSGQESGKVKIITAIDNYTNRSRSTDQQKFILTPTDFPIKSLDVQTAWRLFKKPVRVAAELELDIEATVEKIEREGFFADVVMRPRISQKAELLLLIDDRSTMIPFFRAFEPFIEAINQHRITPAQIYRFTSYPDEYLYEWSRPTRAHHLTEILPKLHRHRTVALIFSDAGAATITHSQQRIDGISKFLMHLSPCIRQLIWLNPLPIERWKDTSAWEIHRILKGKMLSYEPSSLKTAVKEITQQNMIKV